MKKIIHTLIFLLLSNVVYAADFNNATAFQCEYDKVTISDTLNGGNPNIKNERFSLTFTNLDRRNNEATVTGNIGSSKISLINGQGIITFIEITNTGNVMTTSVYDVVKNSGTMGINYYSVHTRNYMSIKSSITSQYYGNCKALN
jgi:hypothetical protein